MASKLRDIRPLKMQKKASSYVSFKMDGIHDGTPVCALRVSHFNWTGATAAAGLEINGLHGQWSVRDPYSQTLTERLPLLPQATWSLCIQARQSNKPYHSLSQCGSSLKCS